MMIGRYNDQLGQSQPKGVISMRIMTSLSKVGNSSHQLIV